MTDQHGAAPPGPQPPAPEPAQPGSRFAAVESRLVQQGQSHWPEQHEFTSNRLNRLAGALGARSYLEIGVEQGSTFELVRVADRTAVDPIFEFDTADYPGETTTFAQMTSDEFFWDLPAGKQYDLIFIDGLHQFEQTYRDLCNSLLHSHPRTAILLDDTLPCDVYSSLRDEEQALAYRSATGDGSSAWHGDTYKVVVAVHDFHLGLDYRTIVGAGNPQTLMWRSNAWRREPSLDSMEAISRMTYFDLIDQIDLLRQYPEELAIKECLAALTGSPSPAPA